MPWIIYNIDENCNSFMRPAVLHQDGDSRWPEREKNSPRVKRCQLTAYNIITPSGKRGRPPKGIEKMLRMYLLQVWFNLSDEGTEDAIYDSYAMRKFVGINFLEEDAPDATTLLKFRRLLEQHGINKLYFEAINRVMVETGHMLKGGTVVDATIINASPSTKNAEKQRDPEMHQTKKGNEWRFGMKCHIGVDAFSGLVHTMEVTPANVHDVSVAAKLIREDDEVVYGDSGYPGID